MLQPPDPDFIQCSQSLPAGFGNSVISRTLQHREHSPQALPGIWSIRSSRSLDSQERFSSPGRGEAIRKSKYQQLSPKLPCLKPSRLCEELADKSLDSLSCAGGAAALGGNDRAKARKCFLQIVVDDNIIIIVPAADFAARRLKPFLDDRRQVLGTALEPRAQFLHRGRQNEDGHRFLWTFRLDLPRALIVDIEENISTFAQDFLGGLAWRSIKIAMHLGPFKQVATIAHGLELLFRDERIMDSIDLTRPARPRRHRNRQGEVEILGLKQHPGQGRFACARRRRKNEHQAPARRHAL